MTTRSTPHHMQEGGTMKGLASVRPTVVVAMMAILSVGFAVTAGPLELYLGAGPSAASLAEINSSLEHINTVIGALNEFFADHPNVTGSVGLLAPVHTGLCLHAGESLQVLDWLAVGARIDYTSAATRTAGQFKGSEDSDIDISLRLGNIAVMATGRATFLDAGVQLAADAGAGYVHAFANRHTTFDVPSEYTYVISGIPTQGGGRFSGGAFGWEVGLSLGVPIADWFVIGSRVGYQSARTGTLTAQDGTPFSLVGDESISAITWDRVTVSLTVSVRFDLSPDGGEE